MDKGICKNPSHTGGIIMKRKIKNRRLLGILLIVLPFIISIGSRAVVRRYKKPSKIVLIPKATDPGNAFWQTVKMGAELAAKEEGIEMEFVGANAEKDIDEQIEVLEQYMEDKDSIILLAPAHAERLVKSVEEMKKNGVVLVAVDSTVDTLEEITSIATNNVKASSLLTNHLASLMEKEGEVVMLNFIQGASTAKDRQKGFEKTIKKYPQITMHTTMFTEGTTESAYRGALKILEKYPNIKGIMAGNQQMTEGVCMAIDEQGLKGKIKVVGFDSSETIVYGIEQSIIDAVIVQRPFNMGYLGVKNAMLQYMGKSIPPFIDTGHELINKETIYTIENQKLLYPIIK